MIPKNMPKNTTINCPLNDERTVHVDNTTPHVESRFGVLESDVRGLKESHIHLENVVTRGFEAVFAKIDNVGKDFSANIERKDTMRSSEVVSKLANTIAIVVLIAGFLYQNFSGISASITKTETNAMQGIIKAENALALANARELLYREDKGRSDQATVDLRARLLELDKKQQEAANATAARVDDRVKAINDKIELAGSLQQRANDAAYASKDEMAAWRLAHVKDNAYAQGMSDVRLEMLHKQGNELAQRQFDHRLNHVDSEDIDLMRTQQQIIEERQYLNTGKISELDWLREPGQKVKLDRGQ